MNEIILFSPVGGTDPISMNNCKDGALLHICRVYKPTKVILYMSKEMLENQQKDDRYRYALEHLFQLQNRENIRVVEIERPELVNVHEFDFFYQDFRKIVDNICAEMDPSDRLLINVSSGTPAMKSGLLVLQTLGEFPAVTIQVRTPTGKMNEHTHEGYDIKKLWEENRDNEPDFEIRCEEVVCPTLSRIKKEEIIKKHIEVYDYQAAVAVAETMQKEAVKAYYNLLKLAEARILLDFPTVDKWQQKLDIDCLPVKEEKNRKYFEYALNLSIKLERKEYADFIRGITPIIVDLFELALKRQCRINIDLYTKRIKGIRQWDSDRLKGTEIYRVLNNRYKSEFKPNMIYSDHLNALISHFSRDVRLKKLAENLRLVESKIRNMAAHEIVSITDEKIKEETGFTGAQIMDKIIEIFTFTGIKIPVDAWHSYDKINLAILKAMNSQEYTA